MMSAAFSKTRSLASGTSNSALATIQADKLLKYPHAGLVNLHAGEVDAHLSLDLLGLTDPQTLHGTPTAIPN